MVKRFLVHESRPSCAGTTGRVFINSVGIMACEVKLLYYLTAHCYAAELVSRSCQKCSKNTVGFAEEQKGEGGCEAVVRLWGRLIIFIQ